MDLMSSASCCKTNTSALTLHTMEKQWCKVAQGGRGSKIKSSMVWEISWLGNHHVSCLAKTTSYISYSTKWKPPIFCVKLSLFMIVKIDCLEFTIVELFSLAIGVIFAYYVPCCAWFGCCASADLSLNKSLYQCFSSINFNARGCHRRQWEWGERECEACPLLSEFKLKKILPSYIFTYLHPSHCNFPDSH